MRPHKEMGFETIGDAVKALLIEGRKTKEIVTILKCAPNTVYKARSELAAGETNRPEPPPPAKIEVKPDNMLVMRVFGSRRGINADEAANRLIDAAVNVGIVEKLLNQWEAQQQKRLARNGALSGGVKQKTRLSEV